MKTVLTAITLLILGAACLFCQVASVEPVPAKWLHDGKLVVQEDNFSISSPSPDPRWSYSQSTVQGKQQTTFIVDASSETQFAVIVSNQFGGFDSDSQNTKSFVNGFQNSVPKGWRVDRVIIEPSTFPVERSSQLTMTIHLPNESTVYAYGYIIGRSSRTYMLLHYTSETTEPLSFHQFAASFALLKVGSDLDFYTLALVLVIVIQVIPIWLSVKAKPIGDKPYRWGTYVGIIFGLCGAYFVSLTFVAPDIYGKEVGAVVGPCMIVGSFGILRRKRFGIVMFVISYLLIMLVIPFLDTSRHQPVPSSNSNRPFPI